MTRDRRRHDHPARHRAAARRRRWTFYRALAVQVGDRRVRRVKSELAIETLELAHDGITFGYATEPNDAVMATTEPRALSAALAAPAFVTQDERPGAARGQSSRRAVGARGGRESRPPAAQPRLRRPARRAVDRGRAALGVAADVQPVRLHGTPERQTNNVSWVFPRPWYQDELDWMAAARQAGTQAMVAPDAAAMPSMLTTRGTYVAPAREAIIPARAVRVRRAVAVRSRGPISRRSRRGVLVARPACGDPGRERDGARDGAARADACAEPRPARGADDDARAQRAHRGCERGRADAAVDDGARAGDAAGAAAARCARRRR